MGDIDDGHAALAQFVDNRKKRLGLLASEAGSWLVHNQNPRLGRERLGNFDELLVANGQVAHQGIRRHLELKLREGLDGPLADGSAVDQSPLLRLAAKVEVGRDREIGAKIEFLVDQGDAERSSAARGIDDHRLAIAHNFATVRSLNASENLHQSGFASPVFADDGEDFSGLHRHIHRVEGQNPGKALANVARSQQRH